MTFEQMCLTYRGVVLEGKFAHCCPDWDDLPIDETCMEFPCACFRTRWSRLKWRIYLWYDWLFPIVCEGHRSHSWYTREPHDDDPVEPYVGRAVVQVCRRCGVESHHYPSER